MTPQRLRWLATFALLPLLAPLSTAWMNDRPVLEVRDGNLFISSAKDRNISMQTLGASYVNVNGINLLQVATSARDASRLVERWKLGALAEMENTLMRLTETIEGRSGVVTRLMALEFGTVSNSSTARPGGNSNRRTNIDSLARTRIQRLTARVRQAELKITRLLRKLETDECASNPCQNGGTCEDRIDGYKCLCTDGWEGPECNTDVNECTRYSGTDLGCQNGATCINLPGSYQCSCNTGWFGIHCTQRSKDCNNQNSNELCGHGVCVDKPGSVAGYTCICDQGWKAEGTNPACIVDVDECAGHHPPCSVSPMVPCINVPGTFYCGGCPQGYTGNGYYCVDIDECATNNGGCSTSPSVECINTMGSRRCGACPPGYQGDGVTCSYVGSCRINNGGCHPLATCVNNPGMSDWYVQCRCPSGYTGDGMGPNGCVVDPMSDHSACSSNPCSHGTCIARGSYDYTCRCALGYTGRNCDAQTHPCDPNPCRNGGTCSISVERTAVCRCASGFSGARCDKHRASCGVVIREPSGSLQFPTAGETYLPGLSCAWILITNTSQVLNVTFTAFNLEQSRDCQYDFLQVHDGSGAGEHMIGRYCGNTLPHGGNIISSEASMYLWFHSDHSINSDGFTLEWNSIPPLCGGDIHADHGAISSPGSPGKYPKNRDCTWHISVAPGKRIQFHFFPIMLEEDPTCSKDYLEIRDGPSTSDRQFGLFCNHTHPPPLITADDEVWVHFHSDGSGQDNGFQLTFSSIPGEAGCGGVYTATTGQITSPNYHRDSYESYQDCDWMIQIPLGERIQITWINFDLEQSRSCRFDSVEIYNGANREAPLIGRYCGTALPPTILSESNVLLIRFKTDSIWGGKGFLLNYEVWCGGDFTEATGVIKSPYYPEPYPASRTCIYRVIQPPGKAIELTIQDMDIEGRYFPDCYFDYLEIHDGDNETSPSLGTFCGGNSSIPDSPIISTHNYMWLKFDTDFSIHQRGFMATYTTIDRGCGGILKTSLGIIQHPSDTGRYENNVDCTWIIQAPSGFVVQLNWLSFDLESHDSCRFDYVKITENITRDVEQDMGTYCGTTKPPMMTSQSQMMSIKFRTDDSVRRNGFSASYIFVDASKVCGGHFSLLTGVIRSPNFPEPYPSNRMCEWVINAPNRHQVVLSVKNFTLESSATCVYDYLEIRNGGLNTSPLLGKFCGTDIPRQFRSFGSQLYLKFESDFSQNHGGFNIEWDSNTIGCGGTLSATRGSISSPDYPQPYSRRAECDWKVRVSAGSIIQFIFVDLDLEEHIVCRYDYIEIYDGANAAGKSLGKYCGTNHPPQLQTSSNFADIRFRSDWSGAGRGFHITYQALCHHTLHGFRGVIESPNFPNNYPHRANCSWIIEAPMGNKLNVTFSHFDLEAGSDDSCDYDYLEIKEGENDVANKNLGKFCDSLELPPKIVSTQRQVFVQFFSDSYTANNGFRLEWVVNGCGGILNHPEGTITSPGYPSPYPENVDCEWQIEVDYLYSIEMTLVDVKLERVQQCNFDKLTLYSGADDTGPKLVEVCHVEKPVVFTSTGNKMFVKFHADYSYQNTGFKATYRVVNITCGGLFTTATGVIHSTNYPSNYPKDQYCEWVIRVPENHLVNLTFVDFDIEGTTNCTDDYVRIYDGATSQTPLLGAHCGNTMPPSYVSTSNELLVLMRTDYYIAAKGFKATYDIACGARIITNDQGIISMDPSVGMHTDITNCTWTIIAQEPDDHVTLILSDIHVSTYYALDPCEASSVQVFEGEGTDGPSLGTWCNTTVPPPITSRGNALTIHASSLYGNLNVVRFSGTYSVLNSACGGNYTAEHGRIATPGYPDNYPRNIECVWYLQTSPGNSISLSFAAFDLIQSENCDLDYVEVREENGAGKLIGVYCNPNVDAITSSKSLWVKFRSSADTTKKGFIADYSLKHGNDLSGPSGEIASPLYPKPCMLDGEYFWRITVDVSSSIQITFKDFHLETFYEECYISVTIYDGYNDDAPQLLSKCGMILPETVRSASNVVYVKFSSSLLRHGSWFLLSWLQVPRDAIDSGTSNDGHECDEIVSLTGPDNSSYLFHSPGWPNGYASNLDCSWTFESLPGTHLILNFGAMELEESSTCSMDQVEVSSGNSLTSQREWTQIGTYCRNNATSEYIEASNLMKVDFHSDWSNNKTGFIASVRKVCGGELSSPNGVIELNSTSHTDRSGSWATVTCQWNVTVRPGRMIEVKFIEMDIQSTSELGCSDNYLLLKNGGSASSPLLGIGKYCHSELPATLQTTGNQLYVKTSGRKSNIKFKLTYREVGISCGGRILLTESLKSWEIETPNYPNIPSPHTECFWTIMAPAGERVTIHFVERFDLTTSAECNREYLEIRDGGTGSSMLMGRYCGDHAPSSLTTSGNIMYLHFYTDVPEPKNGFKALMNIGSCGGIIRGRSGQIKSPNYPQSYPKNTTCGWYIVGPPGHTVKLQFQEINLPYQRSCGSGDSVEIGERIPYNDTGDGTLHGISDQDIQVMGYYCGSINPGVIESSGNEVSVIFTSSSRSSDSYRGFSINFTTSAETCGGTLEDTAGEFSSPGYPNVRPHHHRFCEWKIKAPEGYSIQLDILDLDIGRAPTVGRYAPFMTIWNDFEYRSRIKRLAASDTERQFLSTSSTMVVWFWSEYDSLQGFKARYSRIAPSLCGSAITDDHGTLVSSQSPILNLTSFMCYWKLSAPSITSNSKTLALTVSGIVGNSRGPVPTSTCRYQGTNIVISNGDDVFGCVSGNRTREVTIRSPSPFNKVTAGKSVWGAMTVNYTLKYRWHQCGGILGGPSHTVSAPRDIQYPIDCAWHAKFPDNGEAIVLTFKKLNLVTSTGNYLILRNGGPLSPKIDEYRGSIMPTSNIVSQSNELWIEYHAEDPSSEFELQLVSRQGGCGGLIHGLTHSDLSSPGFPNQYPNNAECTWEIVVDNGFTIGLVFVDRFNLETSTGCSNDFVQVFDWRYDPKTHVASWFDLGKVCGRNTPTPFNSTANRMKILFRSNAAITADGFHALWNTNCGGVATVLKERQYLVTPGWPISYKGQLSCNFTFFAPGKKIIVEFLQFELESGSRCQFDNVTLISDEIYDESVWCNTNRPPMQRVDSRLEVHFKSDKYVQRRGFKIRYYLDECGGTITEPTDIQSPSQDGSYYSRINCTWIVTAPAGQAIVLKFENFHLEYSIRCYYDFVAVYSGLTMNNTNRLALLCGSLNGSQGIVRSENGSMIINFITDYSFNFGGFSAKIFFTPGVAAGCGGEIQLSHSQTFKTQRGSMYESLLDCHWLIRAPDNDIVKLQITSMDLKNTSSTTTGIEPGSCSGDYLEIRDGSGPFSELIGKYCGNVIPPEITSSSNTLWIRLVTDGTINGNGVVATIQNLPSLCGSPVLEVGNQTKALTSPGFSTPYATGLRCRWLLTSANRDDVSTRFTIHFVQFDLRDSSNCSGDALSIADRSTSNYISEGFGENFVFSGSRGRSRAVMFLMGSGTPQGTYSYCGGGTPHDYHSSGGEVEIQFKSSQQPGQQHVGFKLEYSISTCNRNFTAAQGRILHDNAEDCWFTITAAEGYTISLYFDQFMSYGNMDCTDSALEVHEGNFTGASLATLCGVTVPNPIFSSGNMLSLRSWVHGPYVYQTYDITYTTTNKGRGCGGQLYNYVGEFTSPLYPGAYRNTSECTWEVTVPTGYIVQLEFKLFDLGLKETCETDSLEINDVQPNGNILSTTTYCGEDNPAEYHSTSRKVTVKYRTSVNNGGTGWIIVFEAQRHV